MNESGSHIAPEPRPLYRRIISGVLVLLAAGTLAALWERQWLAAAVTTGLIAATIFPVFLRRQYRITVPPEFGLLAAGFLFASVFLGELQDYYTRYWWWDLVLHTGSGFLLGIIGFQLVYVLNDTERIEVQLSPSFVALFAFLFAIGMGALWEVFEFGMDQAFGLNMQKEMLGDPSGLTDTMWDLIVDAVGALVIAVLGYGFLSSTDTESFLERWIRRYEPDQD